MLPILPRLCCKAFCLPLICLLGLLFPLVNNAQTVFINEIHYDNDSDDINEGVEIAGPAGTDLGGWQIVLYNGNNNTTYNTFSISANTIIPNQSCGFGTIWFDIAGIQNGAPDGLALVDNNGYVIQFLSYEGSFTAADGPANGMSSIDIGESEPGSSTIGHSLQLSGTGVVYSDFSWQSPAAHTRGAINHDQNFCVDFCSGTPTGQVSDFGASDIDESSATLSWDTVPEIYTLILAKPGSAITQHPTDGISYVAGGDLSGDMIDGAYVIYADTGSTIALSNLQPGTLYYLSAYAYCPNGFLYNTTSPLTATVLTEPENPVISITCVSETSMELTWTDGGLHDGYVLIGREGGQDPTSIDLKNPETVSVNADFSLAPTNNTVNKFLYKGSGNSVTITGLTVNALYKFKIFAYSTCTGCLNPQEWEYSAGTQTSATALTSPVSNLNVTPGETNALLNWTNPYSCIDEVIVVASDAGSITGAPIGSGYTVNSNSYTDTANPVFDSNTQQRVVYSGTGQSVDVINLTTNSTYCFKVFVRIGAYWSDGAIVCALISATTILQPGDLAIVAVNTIVDTSTDEFCFTTFVTILPGTSIDFTDNGYERQYPGYWGTTEGIIRMTLDENATAIPAGAVICVRSESPGNDSENFTAYYNGYASNSWTFSSINEENFQLGNSNGESIYLMQNGGWSDSGSQQGTYSGNIIFGWNSNSWGSGSGTGKSTLYPGTECFSIDVSEVSNKARTKYTGSFASGNKYEWLARIGNEDYWTGYAESTAYFSQDSLYSSSGVNFPMQGTTVQPGEWTGAVNMDWFNCRNWAGLAYPNENSKTFVPVQTNQPQITGALAKSGDLVVHAGATITMTADAELEVYGDLLAEAALELSGTLRFAGALAQLVDITTDSLTVQNLQVSKTADSLKIDGTVHVSGELDLVNGIVIIPDTSLSLGMGSGSSVVSVSDMSFVDGWVRKTGSTDFTFPIGDVDVDDTLAIYQPLTVFDFAGPTTYRARYVAEAHPESGPYWDGQGNAHNDLEELGHCDYWSLRGGSTKPKVTLHYLGNPCNIINPDGGTEILNMAKWNGLAWDYPLSEGVNPNTYGQISSLSELTSGYGDFVLTSDDPELVVLPVELLEFAVRPTGDVVNIFWTTASETNNDYFTVERSSDGYTFSDILRKQGAGNSTWLLNYTALDANPLPGTSYYRLRQTDFDGASTLSPIVAVHREADKILNILSVYSDKAELKLTFTAAPGPLVAEIYSLTGQLIHRQAIASGSGFATLPAPAAKGVYVIKLLQNGHSDREKFIY